MPDARTDFVPAAGPGLCCPVADAATQKPCVLCSKPTCGACRGLVNGRLVCRACLASIESELAKEQAGASHVPGAVLGGVVGAVVGGGAWALVAIVTGLAIGYVAVAVGFLAGYGVFLGAGQRRGKQLQVVAVCCALLGLVLGKYFIVAHFLIKQFPEANLSYVSPKLFRVFAENVTDFVRPFDILWILLALGAASRATRPTVTSVVSASASRARR